MRNYPITVQFNKNLDAASITDDAITIEGKLNGSYDEYVSVKSYFEDPIVSGHYMTINVATALTAGWRIRVTLDKSLYDTSGLTMTEDYSWQYLTNSSIDSTPPTISSITGATGTSESDLDTPFSGSEANDHRIGNSSKNFYLAVSAADDSGVQNMSVTEVQILDETGSTVSNALSPVVTLYPGAGYSLFEPQTSGDGIIELTISVTDVNGNSSSESTYRIVKDTTAPFVGDNASLVSYTENGQYVSDEIHFTNTGLTDQNASAVRSSAVYWRFAFDASQSTLSEWYDGSSGATLSLQTLGLADGENIPVYVQFADDQMNTSTWQLLSSCDVDLESEAPLVSAVTITNAQTIASSPYVGDSYATLHITGTDSQSGVSHYYLSDSETTPAPTAGGWSALASPSTSADFTVNYTAISEGENTLYLWLKDQAGNISARYPLDTFYRDTTGPGTPSLTGDPTPSAGVLYQSGSTYYTRDSSLDFTFTATDSGSGLAGFNTDSGSTADFTSSLTVNAGQTLSIYAVDRLGNVSTTGLTVSVVQDNLGPSCGYMSVASSAGYTIYWNGTSYFFHDGTLSFSASDSTSAMDEYVLSTISDSSSTSLTWSSYAGGTVTASLPAMSSAGLLYLHLKDKVGNTSVIQLVRDDADRGNTGRTWIGDTTSPSGLALDTNSAAYSSSNDYYTTGTSVTFTFSSTDDGSGVAGYADSTAGTPSTSLDLGTGSHSVYAFDRVGNVSVALGSTLTVIQDNTAPDTPTLTSLTPAADYTSGNNYYTLSNTTRTISLSSSDNSGSGLAGFSFTSDGTPQSTLSLAPEADPATATTRTVYAIDNVGNASSGLNIILVQDTTAPDTPAFDTGDDNYGYFDDSTGIYYITETNNSTDAYFISDDNSGSGVAGFDDTTGGTPTDFVHLSTGNSYTIYAYDNLEQTSGALTISDVIKDRTAPTVTGASLAATATGISGLTTADAGCGIDASAYTSSSGTFTGTAVTGLSALTEGGNDEITVRAYDNLGWYTDVTITRTLTSGVYTATIP